MITRYIGLVDALHTWEVVDDDGVVIGMNQSPYLPGHEPVPQQVSARQLRLWLIRHSISPAAVDAAIDAIADTQTREECRVEWAYSPWIERAHPMVGQIAAALGLTEAQVDDAFREAANI